MKTAYVALLTPLESGSGYYASVPDLDGCATTGANLPDAIEQIRDAMSVYLLSLEDDHLPFPTPSLPNNVAHAPGDFVAFVDADTAAYRRAVDFAPVRKTVTLPSWMVFRADHLNINISNVLQDALKKLFAKYESASAPTLPKKDAAKRSPSEKGNQKPPPQLLLRRRLF